MNSITTDVEITRQNACHIHAALNDEEQQLRADLDANLDPAERAEVFRRAAANQERRAVPG